MLNRHGQGHLLWQGGRVLADYLEDHADTLIQGRTVFELGAGGGLPSLVCAIRGAKQVVVTDYPDAELVHNLDYNVQHCTDMCLANIAAAGYLWGAALPTVEMQGRREQLGQSHFDLILLADLLFNHHCHEALLKSISSNLALTERARALVFFTPYRPWLLEKDMAFFDLVCADETGLEVLELGQWEMDTVMFAEDPGDEKLRRTVFAFEIRWKKERLV